MNFRKSKWLFVLLACVFVLAAIWFSRGAASSFLHQRGLQAKSEWKLQTAIGYFDWSLFLKENFDGRFEKGICLQLRGNFLASQKEFDALSKTEIEDKANLSKLHNAIGINNYSFAKPAKSAESHRQALEFAQSAGERRLEAESLIGLSRVFYHSQGKVDEALANLELAKTIAREVSDERTEAAALRNIGTIRWWFKAELDRPLNEFYFPALELYRKQNDRRGAATMLTLIALAYNSKGDVYRFMQYQNESISVQEQIGDEAGLTDSYMALGDLYGGIGNYRKAREFLQKSFEITTRTGYRLAQIDLESYLAQVHINLDEYDEAIKFYDPSSNHKSDDSALFNISGVAYSYQLKGDHAQAISLYERAFQAYKKANMTDVRFEANIFLRKAECFIALGDWQRASEFMAQVDAALQKADTHSGGEIEAAIVRATIARQENRHEQALKYLEDALETEAQIFAAASTNSLIPPHRRVYENLYNFLFEYSTLDDRISRKADELAFRFLENMRYRSLRNFLIRVKEKRTDAPPAKEKESDLTKQIDALLQRLKRSNDPLAREQLEKLYEEFENVTIKTQLEQPQYLAIQAAKPAPLSEIRERLSPETALVEFLFVGEKVFAFVITQKDLRVGALPIAKSNLAAKTKLLRSLIFRNEADENWLPVSEGLRSNLIDPIERSGAFDGITRIGFVPFGFLHDLPFAALTRRENESVKFLIEDYVLFQTPSATFYAHKTEPSAVAGVTLAFGRSDFSEENLPALEFAEEETRAVAETTRGTALTNKLATETELKRLSGNYDYLHFSTHAVAESEMPLLSRLLLSQSDTDDGNLTVREIFELGLKTKLVTLSACETGQSFSAGGNDFVEQDRIGLIEAFLHAGSKSVLASQFPVSDKPTAEFMKSFYQNLQSHDKAESLAFAQRAMLLDDKLKHPRYWSPFILVGSDR